MIMYFNAITLSVEQNSKINLERIRKWGKKKGMQPLMMSIFVRHINAWMRHKTLDIKGRLLPGNMMHQKLIQAISEQEKIGWGHALRGRISVTWGEIQGLEDEKQGRKKRSGKTSTNLVPATHVECSLFLSNLFNVSL